MKAPPEIAIIMRPEISLLLVGYLSTVIENTSGKIFATARPIMKTSPQATKGEGITKIATRDIIPRTEVHMKNFLDDIFVSISAPAKVPSIRPKK